MAMYYGDSNGKAQRIVVTGMQGPAGPQGPQGATGPQGPAGQGVPAGGTAGQVLMQSNDGPVWANIPKEYTQVWSSGNLAIYALSGSNIAYYKYSAADTITNFGGSGIILNTFFALKSAYPDSVSIPENLQPAVTAHITGPISFSSNSPNWSIVIPQVDISATEIYRTYTGIATQREELSVSFNYTAIVPVILNSPYIP